MQRYFVKVRGNLIPADDEARKAMARIAEGDWLTVEFKRPRNIGQHRKLFAMLNIVVENSEAYPTVRVALNAVKIATGHYELIKVGEFDAMVPSSISFAAMPQDEFDDFYERACDWVVREALRINREQLDEAISLRLIDMAA